MKNTKMNPVVHFEMPFEDKKRMSDFYSNVFGWKTQMMGPSVVISVNDIKEHMKMVKEAGGEVLGEPVEIPTIGWYVSFRDTEGNRVSLLQPAKG